MNNVWIHQRLGMGKCQIYYLNIAKTEGNQYSKKYTFKIEDVKNTYELYFLSPAKPGCKNEEFSTKNARRIFYLF